MKKAKNFYSNIHIQPPGRHRFLWVDAVAFVYIFFKGAGAVLLMADGVFTRGEGVGRVALWMAALAALSAANARLRPDLSAARRAPGVILEIAGFAALLFVFHKFAGTAPVKNRDTFWIAKEWHMLPQNWLFMARISPLWAALEAAAVAALVYMLGERRMRITAFAAASSVALLCYLQILAFPAGQKPLVYLVVFMGPVALAAVAALFMLPRAFSRLALGGALGLLIFWSYSGLLPVTGPSKFDNLPGVSRIYPERGEEALFPIWFMREFAVDPAQNALYTTYGPACGVVRIDLTSRRAEIIEESGLIRFLQISPGDNFIYGTDWDFIDFVTITKKPFNISRRQNLFNGDVIAIWEHILDGQNHYIGATEYPGLAKYTRDSKGTLLKTGFLNFHKLGLMKFRSATSALAMHPKTRRLYIEYGPVDESRRFGIARINPDTMRIEKTVILPEGGLKFILAPEHNAIIAASFYSGNFYEIDADTMKIRSAFGGPLNSRAIVFDARRDVLYATGFLTGRLQGIRYSDKKILFDIPVGKRTNGLALTPEKDMLFVGSGEGIFEVRLAEFTASQVKRR